MQPVPGLKDIVLVGGGHAHVQVLRSFGMRPMPGVRLTVVARELETPYSGMLPGLIAGHYRFEQCHIDLAPLARFAGARLIHAEAQGIDLDAGAVLIRGRPALAFDLASIDTGITPALDRIAGASLHALPVKPIGRFLDHWRKVEVLASSAKTTFRLVVIGGGAGGIELLLAAHYRLGSIRGTLIARDGLLPTHPPAVGAAFTRILKERDIDLIVGTAAEITSDSVRCTDGRVVQSDVVLLVTEAMPPAWLASTGLPLDDEGFIAVDAALRSPGDPRVFAAGDVASVLPHPRPKAGVFAVRHGPPLTRNLRRAAEGRRPLSFTPQNRFLSLISTGDRYAVASRGGLKLEGEWLWRVKDWIDRRFMRRFQDLPAMPGPELPHGLERIADAESLARLRETPMRCGGCGAKVGALVLERVLRRLAPEVGPDLVLGIGDDAALVLVPPGQVSVQTIDYFRAFVDDPYLFGEIAAVHALNDVFAMGAEPRTALALCTVPFGPEAKIEEELYQLLAGALSVLAAERVSLAGGHSSEAAELGLGFAVHGTVEPARALRKDGLSPGDHLILTKALGTGTLFAGAMRGRARSPWLSAALAQMRRTGRAAMSSLRAHGVKACTDVSGFGLLGHLAELTRSSGASVRVDVGALPALEGALELLAQGVTSSLQPENLRLRRLLDGASEVAGSPRFALLFDPQTAGGMLAAVPAAQAEGCVAHLRANGEADAAIIGEVLELADAPRVRLGPLSPQRTLQAEPAS